MYSAREIKKQKILDAAYNLFAKNGYSSTKIIDIAEAAGIGKGTVYEYFDSKETLLLSIIAEGVDAYMDECSEVSEAETKESEKLVQLIQLEAKHIKQNGLRIIKMSQMIMDNGMPENFISQVQELWNKKFYLVKDILNAGIKKGEFRNINGELAAIVIMGATGAYLNMKYGVSQLTEMEMPFDVEGFNHKEFIDLVLNGLQVKN